METHIFNEVKRRFEVERRFEPIETLCVFCGQRHSQDMDDNCFVPLYLKTSHRNEFKKIDIGAPRCPECEKKHARAAVLKNLMLYITVCGAAFFPYVFFPLLGWYCLIFYVFFFVFWAFVRRIYNYYNKITCKWLGVPTKAEGVSQYAITQELLSKGFSFDDPTTN